MADKEKPKDEVVRERPDGEAEKEAKGKPLALLGAAVLVVLGGGAFAIYKMMAPDPQATPEKVAAPVSTKEEAGQGDDVDFGKLQADKPILKIELGELTCTLSSTAAGDSRRKRFKMEPVLILVPHMNAVENKFDVAKNDAMLKRYEEAKPILRQIVISSVLQLDVNEDVDPANLADDIRRRINNYDADKKEIKTNYSTFFGRNRVMSVYFNVFEPR
ncbi:MAG: hypothetical protein AB7F75_10560 [Planctomycetota bacterium]